MTIRTTAGGTPAVSFAGGDRRRWWALLIIALGQLMVVFDVTIVNVALPSIGRAFDVQAAERHWVITAYTVAFAGLLLVGGRVADRIGRKRAFLIALAGFAAASAVGGAAVNLPMLVGARAGQGAFGRCWPPPRCRWSRRPSRTRASVAGRSPCSAWSWVAVPGSGWCSAGCSPST